MTNKTHGGQRKGAGRKTLDGKPAGQGSRSKRIHVTLSSVQMAWVDAQEMSTSDFIRMLVDKDMGDN